MKQAEIIVEARQAFSCVSRPRMFIRGTCRCEECLEHEATMQSFAPDDLPLGQLDNPGWDPLAFASKEAFAFLLPGLISLVLQNPDDYVQQFLFHLEDSERIGSLNQDQTRALLHVLDYLTLECAEALDNNLVVEELFRTRAKLEQHYEVPEISLERNRE
jgi:hypothetical protein